MQHTPWCAPSTPSFTCSPCHPPTPSCSLGRDQLRRYAPSSSGLRVADWLQLGLYIAAYITSVLCTPLDDELKYESGRNPRFWELSFSAGFKKRLNAWHGLNVIRTICAGLGWLLVGGKGRRDRGGGGLWGCGFSVHGDEAPDAWRPWEFWQGVLHSCSGAKTHSPLPTVH